MKRIKPVMKIVVFSLLLLLLFYGLSYLAKPYNSYNLQHIAGLYSQKEDVLDVVYIGGSAAFVYYAPLQAWENYGIVAYDYATDTVQAELYVTMIKEVLKTQSPKLIILDARAFQYRDKENANAQPPGEVPYRNALTGMRLSRNKIAFINQYVGTQIEGEKITYYFDLIKYHKNIATCSTANIDLMRGTYRDPYNGFYFNPRIKPIIKYGFMTSEKRPVSDETERVLIDLLDYLDSTEAEYLFVVSPYAEKKEHRATFNYVREII